MITLPNAIPCTVSTGGIDTAHIGLYVKWKKEYKEQHLKQIHETQKRFKAARKDSDELPQFAIEQYFFEIKPYGYNPGDSKHCYFPFVIESGGIRICLSEREIVDFNTAKKPNVRIEIGSLPLMCYGLKTCWDIVRNIIETLGGSIKKDRLSRIDVCADLANMDIKNIQDAINAGHFICKARCKGHFAEYDQFEDGTQLQSFIKGRIPTGVTIGKSKIMCRIYEKKIESTYNEEKTLALLRHRWNMDCVPENAVRCEFQLRRDALRNLFIRGGVEGIKSISDWFKCQEHICNYLTTVWIRIYKKNLNWKHPERFTDEDLLAEWKQISDAFTEWTGQGDATVIMRNIKQAEVTAEDLAKQSVGCLFSAFIRQGHRIDFKRDDALEQFINLCLVQIMLWWEAHQTDAVKIQSLKELKYNAKNPLDIQNETVAA